MGFKRHTTSTMSQRELYTSLLLKILLSGEYFVPSPASGSYKRALTSYLLFCKCAENTKGKKQFIAELFSDRCLADGTRLAVQNSKMLHACTAAIASIPSSKCISGTVFNVSSSIFNALFDVHGRRIWLKIFHVKLPLDGGATKCFCSSF